MHLLVALCGTSIRRFEFVVGWLYGDPPHDTTRCLSPAALEALLESSQQARQGEFVSSEEVREEFLNE
jgi:hypothetical protein